MEVTKIRCIKTVTIEGTVRFTEGKEYDVAPNPNCVYEFITTNDRGSEHNLTGRTGEDEEAREWFKQHFVVVDELNDAYDRAMGIL